MTQSRESSRSSLHTAQMDSLLHQNVPSYVEHDNTAFNKSFYQQKISSSQTYTSFQYIKSYLKQTNLSFTIEKMMSIVLKMDKLPENPYNLMYRLIHHEAIYENLRRFYNQSRQYQNMINYNVQNSQDINEPHEIEEHIDHFQNLKIKDKFFSVASRLLPYINSNNIFVFSRIINSKTNIDKHKAMIEKYNMQDVHYSFGGPIILNLRGNKGFIDVSSKLPKQIAERSIYCSEAMLYCTLYVNSNRQISKSFQQFAQFIVQDFVDMIQYKDQNYTIYFKKVELFNIDEIFNIIEFSREQIINNRMSVQKQIVKNIEKQNMVIRAKCVYRLSKDLANVVGQQFITVYKEYLLIAKVENVLTVLSNQPLKYALREIFINQLPLQTILDHQQYRNKDLFRQFKIQMVHSLTHNLKNQNLIQLTWQLFYCVLYEPQQEQNKELLKDINQTISYILVSPIWFVYKLIYTLKCAKWLTLPSFPTLNQNEVYQLIIDSQRQITSFIQRGNYIYWQLQIFYEAIKRLLSIIVEFKDLKINSIIFVIDHALLMLNGVTVNFTQILLVLQGNVLSYINILRKAVGNITLILESQQQLLIDNTISYETYIKNKELPTKILKLSEQIKKGKKALNLSENQVKLIIISKYINRYKLYQKIYNFYWELFMNKKVIYPLSKFLKLLMINSTQLAYQNFKSNFTKPKFTIESHLVNQIAVYQINNPQTSFIFYSLAESSLNVYALKQYKALLDIIHPFFEEDIQDDSLGFRYGSKTTIQTNPLNNDRRKSNKVSIGLKSLQIGENIGEQITGFNQCKVLIDIMLQRTFNNKYDLYSYILDYLHQTMDKMDKQNYSVLGMYSYYQNQYNMLNNQEFIYTKILNQQHLIRYDYKKKTSIQRFTKFIDTTITQGKFMQIKIIYTVRDIVKVMKLSFNFYYQNGTTNHIFSIFKPNFILERIYTSKRDLLGWCQLNGFQYIKDYINNNKKISIMPSLNRLQLQKQVSIVDILSQKDVPQPQKDAKIKQFSRLKYYKQSPFYNIFQRTLQMLQNMHILIDYLKSDRRGRYQLSHIQKIYSLLKYYILDRCLIKDDFIYSQGSSVSIINLMTYIEQYIERHPDNNGQERELLYLQRVITKLANLVKFQEISCSLCIYQSLNTPDPDKPKQ